MQNNQNVAAIAQTEEAKVATASKIEIKIRRLETPAATASTGGRGLLSALLGVRVS